MPRVQCPIEGFDEVYITYPDEWLMEHMNQYAHGFSQAPDNAALFIARLFATIALCEKIEGIDLEHVTKLPLSYRPMFKWMMDEVLSSYNKAALTTEEAAQQLKN